MVSLNDITIVQLTFFAYREGQRLAPGSRDAMLGIAHVIGNRVNAGWEGGDWLRVIANAAVHSANNKVEMDTDSYVDVWSQDFRWLAERAEQIFTGILKDAITVGADIRTIGARVGQGYQIPRGFFYANLNNVTRDWFRDRIIGVPEEHKRTATVGTVTFFG